MSVVNVDTVAAALIGASASGLAAVMGNWIRHRTKIDTTKIDERAVFVKELMQAYDGVRREVIDLQRKFSYMERREDVMTHTLSALNGEMRLLNGLTQQHTDNLVTIDDPRLAYAIAHTATIISTVKRMVELAEAAQKSIIDITREEANIK